MRAGGKRGSDEAIMGQVRMARWTFAWFAAGLGFLGLALGLLIAGFGPPQAAWEAGESRAILHLFVLGWIGSLMIGASLQFVPVLAAAPLAFEWLSPVALGLWAGGTMALGLGFWLAWPAALRAAAAGLSLSAGGGLAMLVPPVIAAIRRERLVWPLAIGLAAMAATVVMGAGFALSLAGGGGLMPLPGARSAHAILGLGLWFGLSAMAVSLKFLSMFGLAPAAPPRALAALSAGGAAMLVAVALPDIALGIGAGVTAIYLFTGIRMLRARRLHRLDPALAGAGIAVLALAPGLALLFVPGGALPGGLLLGMGWLSGLTLAFMPKITAFLTWMEVFGPLIGRAPVPPAAALAAGRGRLFVLALWLAGTVIFTSGTWLEQGLWARGGAAVMMCAAALVLAECLKVRRLSHLPLAGRPPRPALVFIHS